MGTRIMSERRHKEEVGADDRINAAVAAMRARHLWPVVLNVAQSHGIQPRAIFDVTHQTRAARGEVWRQLVTKEIGVRQIAQWWGTTQSRVEACIGSYMRDSGLLLLRSSGEDEVTPRLIAGYGDRRDDCKRYDACLAAVSRGFGGNARCPRECSGFVKLRLNVLDYMRAKPCGDKYAAPKSGGWASD